MDPPLDTAAAVAARAARLAERHVAPLEAWRRATTTSARPLPHVDPADGGTDARLLLLLETPGPAAAGDGPRFVSRDNRTGTGRNLRRFLDVAGIARADTLIWNVVPWVVHAPGARNRAVRRAEVADGLALLPPVLALLPRLRVAVLAGRPAAAAAPLLAPLPVLEMPHPSPTIVCTSPAIGARIADTLARAAALLDA